MNLFKQKTSTNVWNKTQWYLLKRDTSSLCVQVKGILGNVGNCSWVGQSVKNTQDNFLKKHRGRWGWTEWECLTEVLTLISTHLMSRVSSFSKHFFKSHFSERLVLYQKHQMFLKIKNNFLCESSHVPHSLNFIFSFLLFPMVSWDKWMSDKNNKKINQNQKQMKLCAGNDDIWRFKCVKEKKSDIKPET